MGHVFSAEKTLEIPIASTEEALMQRQAVVLREIKPKRYILRNYPCVVVKPISWTELDFAGLIVICESWPQTNVES